jgi:hypothetical protein
VLPADGRDAIRMPPAQTRPSDDGNARVTMVNGLFLLTRS